MTGILYDCLVYEPDVTVALSPTDVVRPKRSPLLLSLWLLFWSPWAWLRRWGGKRPAEDERPSAALQDFQLAASRGHEAVAVLQRQPTGCTLRLRFAASAYLTVHEEELPGPVGTGGGGGGAVALAEDGRYCAVWNGQLWVFRLSGGAGSSAVENDEAPTEEEVTVQLLQTRPLPSRSSLASPAPLQLATAEGGRAIVGLAKSLLAPLGVRHLEFYRPPADAPDGDPDLPPPLLLLLPEDGLYVCAVPCGGGGGEEGAAVDRAFDATGPRSLLVSAADASSARHITAFACHAGTHTVALTCHTAAPTVQGGTILSMAFSPEDRLPEALDMYARVIELEPVGNAAVKDKMAALRRRLARDDCGQPPGPSRVSVEDDGPQCPPAAAAVQATSDRVQAQLDRAQVTSTTQDHSIALGAALKGRHTTDDEDLQQLLLPACRLTTSMLLADHRAAAGNGPAGCCCLFLALPSGSTLLSRGICFVSAMVFWVPQQPRAVFWLMSGDAEGVLATAWQAYGRGGVPVTRGNLLRGDFDDAHAAVLQGDGAVDTFCPDFLSRCSDRPPFLEATYLPVSADGVPLGPSAPLQSLLATLPVGDR